LLSFFSVFNSDPTIELLIAFDLKAEPPGREATMKTIQAALYARVSSEQQAAAHTIESQLAALTERARSDGTPVPVERRFVDEGFSGATLVRPALDRLRDLTATGVINRIYVHSPDRLARNYAYQVLLIDEWRRGSVDVVFLNRPLGQTPGKRIRSQNQVGSTLPKLIS